MFLKFTSKDLLAAFRTRKRCEAYSIKVLFQMFCLSVFKFYRIRKIMKA